jgi:hypothetical protein
MKNIFSTPEYNTGRFWYFDNGQYAEKLEIKEQDHYEILYSSKDGSELGLRHWKSNDTGNNHFGGGLYSISGLTGKMKEIYENLKEAIAVV